METKELTCINCPNGCNLLVNIDGDNIIISGNLCEKGKAYAICEVTNPMRIVTSIIKTDKNNYVSCKTDRPIPKDMVLVVAREMKKVIVKEPIKIKDILIKNVCGLDANVVATKNM